MPRWILSSFDEPSATILTSTDEGSSSTATAAPLSLKRKPRAKSAPVVASLGAILLVAAATMSPLHMSVSASDGTLVLKEASVVRNVMDDRPPLSLLFGGKHESRWTDAKDAEMLEKALANILGPPNDEDSRFNTIQAALTEALPAHREDAVDIGFFKMKSKRG